MAAASFVRFTELRLLLPASAYILTGAAVIYLGRPETDLRVLLAAAGAVAGFFLVSLVWGWQGYYGDQFILPLVAVLTGTGLIFLWRLNSVYALKQVTWLAVGLVALLLVTRFLRGRTGIFTEYKYIYAVAGVLGLLLPIFLGVELGGYKSWLDLGFAHVQPSEFVKILLVLFLAAFLEENRRLLTGGHSKFLGVYVPQRQEWGPLLAMWGVSLLLLVFQKDLGTALVYFATFLVMVYAATARISYMAAGIFLFGLGAVISYNFFSHVRGRVDVWLNPWQSHLVEGSGYQVIQSLFAIRAGGMVGTGFDLGYPGFIPAVHTDFIFAAICEEMGLLGGAGVLLLFIILVYRGCLIALQARDDFSVLAATGLTSLLALQVFIIVAGVTKMLPLTGIVLPFISYGGSSLVANFILVGLLLNLSHELKK
ncbi:MAG: FtsW/RodA/SpoVE family cell cycle protein [Bacillota bacterium]